MNQRKFRRKHQIAKRKAENKTLRQEWRGHVLACKVAGETPLQFEDWKDAKTKTW